MSETYGKLDIAEQWGRLNDSIVALVDYIPEDKLDWSPRETLWDLRNIVEHVSSARHQWLGARVKDGETTPESRAPVSSKERLKEQLQLSWLRMERFLSDQPNLDRGYESERRGEPFNFSGHWIAFHLLEHDIHHRSDIFHYLALLEIEHPEVGTP